jgi:hypothetical protein
MPEQQKVDDVIESSIIDKKNLKKVEKSSTALENEHGQDIDADADAAVVIEAEQGQDIDDDAAVAK